MDGFSFGVVSDEVTIPVYEFTKTIAHKTQTPVKIRKEARLNTSPLPIIELNKLVYPVQEIIQNIVKELI